MQTEPATLLTRDSVLAFLRRFDELAERKDFDLLQDLVHDDAFYRFNDGDFVGKAAVRGAFEKTWQGSAAVADERFEVTDVVLLTLDAVSAAVTYSYRWQGRVGGGAMFSLHGRGTRVLAVQDGRLQIIHEHLSRQPKA